MPEYRDIPEGSTATTLCSDVNAALMIQLDELMQLPGISLYRLDAAALLAEAIANPPTGITNVNKPAWTGGFLGTQQAGELSPDHAQYLFFDEVHPAHVWHRMVANAAIALLESRTADLPLITTPPLSTGASLSPALDYWTTYLSTVLQGSPSDTACRY
jgi:phospholipase/lecithinase/hemolysin